MKYAKLLLLTILPLLLMACSNAEPKVYSLSEMGQMKHNYKYSATSKNMSNTSADTRGPAYDGYDVYIRQFQVMTLNNGMAFVTILLIDNYGAANVVDMIFDGSTAEATTIMPQSNTVVYYAINLSGSQPSLSIMGEAIGPLSEIVNFTPVTVYANFVR